MAAPWLAVLAAAGGAMAKVKLEVQRVAPERTAGPGGQATGDAEQGDMPIIRTDAPGWEAPPRDQV